MAVESTLHKTHCGKPFNKAFCAQRAIRSHRVPKTREGGLIPLSTGVLGDLPHFFFNFGRFHVSFNGGYMHLGPDFSPFGHDLLLEKIFLVMRVTECWTKLFSDSHDFFLLFFLQHVSLT